ncbi:CaiB/BaiF CoA-transferase family protein [Sphingosinicella sp. CPCC 101087]|uniref:CaiB/BaiF CoA transferase family protein n=1 Tax=Sphingosinicella sp. CPCC 101087 TaxID=2497754 RepID=UPI00101BC579|nr:CaiB/BaiF CoA-transferase family protein [Sphingosinicella sp. CPCC 101087]
MAGPLEGIRIVEIGGIGPGPFAGMMLADHGAEVIRVERDDPMRDLMGPLLRSRRSVTLDLKSAEDVQTLRALCKTADGIIEGFRPGVMERLGIGPDVLLGDNPRLVYGRMTGWGQTGPCAQTAGHDINYIARSGVLAACARVGESPVPPMNLVGDFGGGGLLLAFGMVSALLAVRCGGPGQVIDCAMTDGSALLMTMIWGLKERGLWSADAGTNLLDTGAPFYDVYKTADAKFMAVGSIEPQFFAALCKTLDFADDVDFHDQHDRDSWPAQRRKLTARFRSENQTYWARLFDNIDACVAPVLSMDEAADDPHNVARRTFIELGGMKQPAPAPRYSRTSCPVPRPPRNLGEDQELIEQFVLRRPRSPR